MFYSLREGRLPGRKMTSRDGTGEREGRGTIRPLELVIKGGAVDSGVRESDLGEGRGGARRAVTSSSRVA